MKKSLVLLLAFALAVIGCPTGPIDVGVEASAVDAAPHRLGGFNPTATGTGIPHIVGGVQNAAASTIVDSDVAAGAAIASSKVVQATGTGIPHVVGGALSAASSLIVDADVSASAAIAGSKISPNFGAQTVQTTGGLSVGTTASFGTTPATTGVLRAPSTQSVIATRNAANTANFVAVATDASDNLFVGSADSVATNGYTQVFIAPASFGYLSAGGTNIALWSSGSFAFNVPVSLGQPLLGNSSPYAMNGQDSLAYAGAGNLTLLAADYSNASVTFTGARTAVGTVTIPAATNAQAYFKWFQNSTTGGFVITLTTGSGTTQALGAGGTSHLFRVDGSGITLLI